MRYAELDSWDRMLQQGVQLLERFCQEDRVRIRQPRRNLQIKFVRPLSEGNDSVAYVDALGQLDDRGCLLEWKTTSSRYPEQPEGLLAGLLALDPQLVCYTLQSSSCLIPDLVIARPFPSALTTMVFDHSRRRWFGACPCRPVPVGIELGRANGEVEGYHPRPFGCEVGSHFHQRHVSRGPPIMPDGRISRVRFEVLAFRF